MQLATSAAASAAAGSAGEQSTAIHGQRPSHELCNLELGAQRATLRGQRAVPAAPAVPAVLTGLGRFLQVRQLQRHQVPQPGEQHAAEEQLHLLREQALCGRLALV